jgi:hypothetical protein
MKTENIYTIEPRRFGFLLSGPNLSRAVLNVDDGIAHAIRNRPQQPGSLSVYRKTGEFIERREWGKDGKLL